MEKSAAAFRTISEVADLLETPAHVLRFWESRFPQIKPVKRAGGRRYYRPGDVALLAGIKRLLHDEGMTIRGVQKILREQGVRHVSGVSETESEALDAALTAAFAPDAVADKPEAQIVSLSDWVGVADAPQAPKTAIPESTIPEVVSPEALPSNAATHPATTIEPVITDDEIVEEDAFRSAMDWAKSLGTADTSVSAPTDAILQLTERVAIEAGKLGNDPSAEAEFFEAEIYATIDDDFDPEDDRYDAALSSDAAAESPSVDPAADLADQPDAAPSATPDSMAAISPAPMHEETAVKDDGPSIWLPTQLRTRTAADLAPNAPALRPLHARLAALHSRMAEAARSSRT